jgi:hypothetical protein
VVSATSGSGVLGVCVPARGVRPRFSRDAGVRALLEAQASALFSRRRRPRLHAGCLVLVGSRRGRVDSPLRPECLPAPDADGGPSMPALQTRGACPMQTRGFGPAQKSAPRCAKRAHPGRGVRCRYVSQDCRFSRGPSELGCTGRHFSAPFIYFCEGRGTSRPSAQVPGAPRRCGVRSLAAEVGFIVGAYCLCALACKTDSYFSSPRAKSLIGDRSGNLGVGTWVLTRVRTRVAHAATSVRIVLYRGCIMVLNQYHLLRLTRISGFVCTLWQTCSTSAGGARAIDDRTQ